MTDSPARTLALRRWEVHPPVARDAVCAHCGAAFVAHTTATRYCRQACRQMAWQHRQKSTEHGA